MISRHYWLALSIDVSIERLGRIGNANTSHCHLHGLITHRSCRSRQFFLVSDCDLYDLSSLAITGNWILRVKSFVHASGLYVDTKKRWNHKGTHRSVANFRTTLRFSKVAIMSTRVTRMSVLVATTSLCSQIWRLTVLFSIFFDSIVSHISSV